MKKILLFCLAIPLIGTTLTAFQEDCYKNFHSGHFTLDGQNDKYKLIRTEQSQTEIFNDGKSKIYSSIKWLSQNEYELKFDKMVKVSGCLKVGDVVKVKITSCTNDKIVCEYTTANCGTGTQTFVRLK